MVSLTNALDRSDDDRFDGQLREVAGSMDFGLGDAVHDVHALDNLAEDAVTRVLAGLRRSPTMGAGVTLMKNCEVALSAYSGERDIVTVPRTFFRPFAASLRIGARTSFGSRSDV